MGIWLCLIQVSTNPIRSGQISLDCLLQKQSKDEELIVAINIICLRTPFLILAGKLRYKSSIIRTSGLLAGRSPRPTPRGATLSVSFLTCIKPRFLLSVLKFQISDSLLQGCCVDISHFYSIVLKNQQRQVLDPLSWRFKQRALRKHHLLTSLFH